MSKCKILLFPSLADANSNTVREAYFCKCLPLITENVGYHELFPDFLICKNYEESEWSCLTEYVLDNYDSLKNTKINAKSPHFYELMLGYLYIDAYCLAVAIDRPLTCYLPLSSVVGC